jgi:hypothetical protein
MAPTRTSEALVKGYLEGKSIRHLAVEAGMPYATVHGVLKRNKVEFRSRGGARPQVKKLHLSWQMRQCLIYLAKNPGRAYDKIPFPDRTINALVRQEAATHSLMIPSVTDKGKWYLHEQGLVFYEACKGSCHEEYRFPYLCRKHHLCDLCHEGVAI